MQALDDWSLVGDRVRTARVASGRSQSELADAIGVDRTAIGRVESGARRLSLLEAAALADRLSVDLSLLLGKPLPAVTSHRRAPSDESTGEQRAARAALVLEQHAADTAWLIARGYLEVPERPAHQLAAGSEGLDAGAVEQAARQARADLGLRPSEPVGPLADLAEALGIFLVSVDDEIEGASVDTGDWAVAVVGARAEPGRRRMTAAHEIGHQVLGDEYSVDLGVSASTVERERVVDRFAVELLLPVEVVAARLASLDSDSVGDSLIGLAAEFRVSWRVAIQRAVDTGVLPGGRQSELSRRSPTRGDFMRVLGRDVPADLEPGSAGRRWTTAVLDAYVAGDLGKQRTLRLLGGRLLPEQLPRRPDDDLW